MRRRQIVSTFVISGLVIIGLAVGCSHNQRSAPAPTFAKAVIPAAPKGLHNVFPIGTKLVSGSVPEGDAGFEQLRAMGIKTIISVDGATPDVTRAQAQGLRYVHIPITYAQATPEQQLAIARAVRDLPGPIYLHCHHGKHRAPAAAASAAVVLGEITPDEGLAFMKTAGTSPSYAGLYACVANATPAPASAINAAPANFEPIHKPEGITASMVEIDEIFDHLKAIRDAGWKPPANHPDLVPAAEAGRLADALRISGEDRKTHAWGPAFQTQLASSVKAATALEDALAARQLGATDASAIEALWKPLATSCTACHAVYRDRAP